MQGGSGGSGGTAVAAGAGANAGGGQGSIDGGSVGGSSAGSGSAPDAGAAGCAPDVPLRRRPEGTPPAIVDGRYDVSEPGWSRLARNTEWMQLSGQGYVALRWEIEYATRAGLINLPTIAPSGVFLRVGGGGGYHLDDPEPGTTGTYMGNAEQGVSYMPPGVETPWNIEYYYLDGDVTITINESGGCIIFRFARSSTRT